MTSTPLQVQAVGCSSRAIAAQHLISTHKPVEQNEQLAAAIVTSTEATCAAGTDTVAACHKHGQAKWQSSQSSATGTPWDGRVHH